MTNLPTDAIEKCIRAFDEQNRLKSIQAFEQLSALKAEIERLYTENKQLKADNGKWWQKHWGSA